jgi:hypothetical protein
MGRKRKWRRQFVISAIAFKADIRQHEWNVSPLGS